MSNSDSGRTGYSDNQCHSTNIPFHTPRPPNLGPIRLPSLAASENTSQWPLCHEESSQSLDQRQSRDIVENFDGPSQDLSLEAGADYEATCGGPLSDASRSVRTRQSLSNITFPLVSSTSSGQDMSNFSGTSVHLQSMRIPQHLRSMSVASATNSVYGEQGTLDNAIQDGALQAHGDNRSPRRARYSSSTGFESRKVPYAWGRVMNDDASSVYSAIPQVSRSSTPQPGTIIERHPSSGTIRFSNSPIDNPSSLTVSADLTAEIVFSGSNSSLKQELKRPDESVFVALDGGRSTPNLTKPTDTCLEHISWASNHNDVPRQCHKDGSNVEEQKLVKKRSMMQSSTSNLKALLPRAKTRIFSIKNDLATNLDGSAEQRSKRAKSMYSLHTAEKKTKQSDPCKPRPFKDEISDLFNFSSPGKSTNLTGEEKNHSPDMASGNMKLTTPDKIPNNCDDSSTLRNGFESKAKQPKLSAQSYEKLGSWNKYPSYQRAERNQNAGPRDHVYAKDFAPQTRSESSTVISERTEYRYEKKNASKKVVRSRVAKSRSMVFGKTLLKSYTRLFKPPSDNFQQRAHGHRSSLSVSGVTEHPELEMISAVFPNAADTSNSSQSVAGSASNSPNDKSNNEVPTIKTARQWSQIYESCVELPRISEGDDMLNPDKAGSNGFSEYSEETSTEEGIVRSHKDSASLSCRSLRDSTVNLAKALQASEARERAKVMHTAQGD